jgi:hypothetical protein
MIGHPIMRLFKVPVLHDCIDMLADFPNGSEHIRIKNFGAKGSVEALDERIIHVFPEVE